MSALLRPVRAYPVTTYWILACGFGWMFEIASALRGSAEGGQFPLGPIIAAAIVAAALGPSGLRDWSRRLATVRTAPRWWLIAFLGPIVLMVAAVLVNAAFGAPLPSRAQLSGWPALGPAFLGIFVAIGIGEEAGWTAFASPRLLQRHPFVVAALALSFIRVTWHLPLLVEGNLPWVVGVVANAGFQFLVLWAFVRSGGVWWLAAIWHTTHNTVGGQFLYRMVEGADQARLGGILAVAYWLAVVGVLRLDRRIAESARAVAARGDEAPSGLVTPTTAPR